MALNNLNIRRLVIVNNQEGPSLFRIGYVIPLGSLSIFRVGLLLNKILFF